MAFELARIHLFDRNMEPVPEIAPSELISAVMSEEINGEHELVITTPRRLEEGWRALTVDATGKWREWVVTETPQEHSSGAHAIGTYRFVWSLQYDLTNSYFHDTGEAVSIGMGTDTTASTAAQYIVDAAVGWTVGNCDAPDIAAGTGCVFIRESAWSKLSKLVECTGFEVDSDIDVDRVHAGISGSDQYCVRNRDIILTSHIGSEVATRRFDWGYDIANIKRTPDPGPYYCRVVPLGKGEQEYADDDETTFDYPIDITEEVDEHGNPYPYYLQDDEAAAVFRIKSSYDGSWIYPTIAVSYNEDDPELLLKAAQEDLHKYTRPNVTYEADVLQFSQAGMDVRGVALGDEVQIVDHGFNPDAALRLQGRVTKIETDLLSPETGTTLTIGNLRDNMADAIAEANSELDALVSQNADIRKSLAGMNTTRYVQELLERINTEIAATGGYTYLVEGEGLITYDKAVVDPLSNLATDGTYATRVIQLKGGYLRIAEDANAGRMGIDDWNFTTLLEAGHIVSDLITTVKIVAGYIGDANNGNYWNLDTGQIILSNGYIGDSESGNYWNLGTGKLVLKMIAGGWSSGSADSEHYKRNPIQQITTTHGVVVADHHTYDRLLGQTVTGAGRYILGLKIDNNAYDSTTGLAGTLNGQILLMPFQGYTTNENEKWNAIASPGNLQFVSNYPDTVYGCIRMSSGKIRILPHGDYNSGISATPTRISIRTNNNITSPNSNGLIELIDDDSNTTTAKIIAKNIKIKGSDVCVDGPLAIGKSSDSSTTYTYIYNDVIAFNSTDTSGSNTGCILYGHWGADSRLYSLEAERLKSTYIANMVRLYCTTYADFDGDFRAKNFSASGTKSRIVNTEDYGRRLLYCYETATPMFGDIGSSKLDEDGIAYVMIDDVFSETAHTDFGYQVFLQKCGQGDIWVEEKYSSYFVVKGTPFLSFDWELKGRQYDFENLRLDDKDIQDAGNIYLEDIPTPESVYDDYIHELEHLYDDDYAA